MSATTTAAGYPDWERRPSLQMLFGSMLMFMIGELLGVPAADRAMFQPLVRDWTPVLEILNPLAVDRADTAAIEIRRYLALLETPAQADRLRAEPELAKTAAEELLRYDTPVQMLFGRKATQDMLIGDLEVHPGQRLVTVVGAANRDPDQFSEPDGLRLDRDEGPVLSFGGGIHHCLGAALARLEAQVMLPELLRRYPSARLAGVPVRRSGLTLGGYASLPIALGI
jgi:cytochrome P450